MKQSNDLRTRELFQGSKVVRRYSFKTIETRENSALLARENHNLSMNFADTRGCYALFEKKDCFECLSPQVKVA